MGLFGSRKDTQQKAADGLAAKAFKQAVQIANAGEAEDILRSLSEQAASLFNARKAGVAMLEHGFTNETAWSLEVVVGEMRGQKISENDCKLVGSLKPGNFILSSDQTMDDVKLKTIALSFRDGDILGCQSFKGRISLHREPTVDNDLGEGKLDTLAVPMTFTSHATLLSEKVKIGVLILFDVPIGRDINKLCRDFARLVSLPLALSRQTFKDPLTGLRSEAEIQGEVKRQAELFKLTEGKLKGGIVFGLADNLTHYKKTIENEMDFRADTAAQLVNDILRGVGQVVAARCMQFPLEESRVYKSGVAGRVGVNGFACCLPLLSEDELVRFARALQADVTEYHFPGEQLLEQGQITVSVRVLPFDKIYDGEMTWLNVRDELGVMYRDQSQARGTAKLKDVTATLSVHLEKKWLEYETWKSQRAERLARQRAAAEKRRQPARPAPPSGAKVPPPPGARPPRPPGPGGPGGPRPAIGQRRRGPTGRGPRRPGPA